MHQEVLSSVSQAIRDMFFDPKTDPAQLLTSARAMSGSNAYMTNRPAEVNKFRQAKQSVKAVRRFYPNAGPQLFSHPHSGMSPAKNYGYDFADKRAAIFG